MLSVLERLMIQQTKTIKDALAQIDENAMGVCFVVDKELRMKGLLSDGDIRRAILNNVGIDEQVSNVMNTNFFSLPVETDNVEIIRHLSDEIRIIPLLDKTKRLVDYASFSKIRRIAVSAPFLTGNELAYVTDCIVSNWISSQGLYVRKFEQQLSDYHEGRRALAVSNGTVALHLALAALGIGKGDEVIVPDLTFAATVNAVLYTGATPILADVNLQTWNIDIQQLSKCVTVRTKAILVVHLYGLPCDMAEISAFAASRNLLVVEDCAEALGSTYQGRPVGVFGDAATFSFYGNKTITTGEGGMVVFKDPKIASLAEVLRDHGMSKSKRYWHDHVGYNYRMTNIQAAIGVAQFERLHEFISSKQRIANYYDKCLRNFRYFTLPHREDHYGNSYWLFTALIREDAPFGRDSLIEFLATRGIESRPVFYSLHIMPIYQTYAYESCPNSVEISTQGISLPSSSNLTDGDLKIVCDTISEFCTRLTLNPAIDV